MGAGKGCPMCHGTGEVYGATCPQCGNAPWHGKVGGYTNHGCRCGSCGLAWRRYHHRYQKKWRAARRSLGLTVRGTEPKIRRKK